MYIHNTNSILVKPNRIFDVTLKPNSDLRKQRPSKVPLHLKDKLEKILGQLQETGIIREMGDDDELGSLFVNPIILLPKADYVKLVIDARYLNSITDLINYFWPLEPVQMIMTRINSKYLQQVISLVHITKCLLAKKLRN